MKSTIETPAPDLAAVKQRQQQAWASGDFHAVAARIVLVAEQLVDSADLHAGSRVLDVATGSGNAAIAAARLGCTAVGVDYVSCRVFSHRSSCVRPKVFSHSSGETTVARCSR